MSNDTFSLYIYVCISMLPSLERKTIVNSPDRFFPIVLCRFNGLDERIGRRNHNSPDDYSRKHFEKNNIEKCWLIMIIFCFSLVKKNNIICARSSVRSGKPLMFSAIHCFSFYLKQTDKSTVNFAKRVNNLIYTNKEFRRKNPTANRRLSLFSNHCRLEKTISYEISSISHM
jgi:hypothetical protein